jgi:fumarate reductase iron-sulfur subunit
MSVLDVIRYIYENLDRTLSFREACKIGWCGCCVVIVNGKAALSCQEIAEEEKG